MRLSISLLLAFLRLSAGGFALDFSTQEMPWAIVDQPYTPPPLLIYGAARCPAGDAGFGVEGALPPGLGMTALGQITGVPTKIGVYRIVVRAADACGATVKPVRIVVNGAPILVVEANNLEFHFRRGDGIPATQEILVSGTWPDHPYYFDRPDAPWLRASPKSGRTPKAGAAVEADRVEIGVEPDKLAPGRYDAKLRFWTWHGANSPVVSIRLMIE